MNKKYYYDNGITTILNQETRIKLQKSLVEKYCKQCSGKLFIYVSSDSVCICCDNDLYHKTGFYIDMDFPNYNISPKIIEELEKCEGQNV